MCLYVRLLYNALILACCCCPYEYKQLICCMASPDLTIALQKEFATENISALSPVTIIFETTAG